MSIRPWLNYTYQMFRSQSPDIGYQRIAYAQGRYVAVGHQKAFPPTNSANAGGPVTAAGCSWSTDGVNWTDARLPFAGTTTYYNSVSHRTDTTNPLGIWQAISLEGIINGGVPGGVALTANYAVSTDNAATWTTDPAGRQAGVAFFGNCSIGNLFFALGQTQAGVSISDRGTGFRTGALRRTEAAGEAIWSSGGASNATAGVFTNGYGSLVFNNGAYATIRDAQWGNRALGVDGKYATSDTIWFANAGAWVALVSENNASNPPFRYRNIWATRNGTLSWTREAQLPYIPGVKGPYYQMALASNTGIMAVIGDGVLLASRNLTAWTEITIPAGAWRGIASNGTDFVCVSATGDRLKIAGSGIETRVP